MKRLISLLLIFSMVITLLPASALAEEAESEETEMLSDSENKTETDPETISSETEEAEESPYAGWTAAQILAEFSRLTELEAGDALDEFVSALSADQQAALAQAMAAAVGAQAETQELDGYSLHFDANGGTDAPADLEQASEASIPSQKPSRKGYDFCGWALTAEATAARYQPGDTIPLQEDTTLYAVWEIQIIASGECGMNLTWKLDSSGVFTLSGTGSTGDFTADGNGVHTPWRDVASKIKSIVIGEGITGIGAHAFRECLQATISLPDTLKTIGRYALPGDIGEISVPEGVTSLDLTNCYQLKSIYVPASVTELFVESCYWLEKITVAEGNPNYSSREGVLFNKDGTTLICYPSQKSGTSYEVPQGTVRIQTMAFTGCEFLQEIVFPESLKTIEYFAFSGCPAISGIHIPAGVTSIGVNAFGWNAKTVSVSPENPAYTAIDNVLFNKAGDELVWYPSGKADKSYTVPDGVTTICPEAFSSNGKLLEVILPASVTRIENHAFGDCALQTVKIKGSRVAVGYFAFGYCEDLQKIYFTGNPPVIDSTAFTHVGATVYYPQENEQWRSFDFQTYGGGVTWVSYMLPEEDLPHGGDLNGDLRWELSDDGTLTVSGFGSMSWNTVNPPWYRLRSQIRKVSVRPGVTGIGWEAFRDCESLEAVELPKSLQYISSYAFAGCVSLKSVTIPENVYSIHAEAFADCTGLETVHLRAVDYCTIYENAFRNVEATVYYYGNAFFEENQQDYGGSLTWVAAGQGLQDFTVTTPQPMAPGFTASIFVSFIPRTAQADISFRVLNPEIAKIEGSGDSIAYSWCALRGLRSGETSVIVTDAKSGITKTVPVVVAEAEEIPSGTGYETQLEITPQSGFNEYGELSCLKFFSFTPTESGNYRMKITFVNSVHDGDVGSGGITVLCGEDAVQQTEWNENTGSLTVGYALEAGTQYRIMLAYLAAEEPQTSTFTICKADASNAPVQSIDISKPQTVVFWPDGSGNQNGYINCWNAEGEPEWGTDRTDIIRFTYLTQWSAQFEVLKPGTAAVYCRSGDASAETVVHVVEAVPVRVNESLYLSLKSASVPRRGIYFTAPEDGTYSFQVSSSAGSKPVYFSFYAIPGGLPITMETETGSVRYFTLKQGQTVKFELRSEDFTGYLSVKKTTDDPVTITPVVLSQYADQITLGVRYSPVNGAVVHIVDWQVDDEKICAYRTGSEESAYFDVYAEGDVTITAIAENGAAGSVTVHVGQCLKGHDYGSWHESGGTFFVPEGSLQRNCSRCSSITFLTVAPDGMHTLTFDANGGSGAPESQTKYAGIPLAISETVPVRPCCTFAGWAERADAAKADYHPGDNFPVNADTTLYAVWETLPNCLNAYDLMTTPADRIFADGREVSVGANGEIQLDGLNAKTLVVYQMHSGEAADVHTQYPTGMQVYLLKKQGNTVTAEHIPELDNILQYAGSSIRIAGNKGIRMITAIDLSKKSALTGTGLGGLKLVEYGTLLAQTSKLGNSPLVLGGADVKSNYAYKRGTADPVFAVSGNRMQYTNVLVGFHESQCAEDIAMRPYMIVEDAGGTHYTIYGGTVLRSIGYIAWQNRNSFTVGTEAYEYVWAIIHNVYGDLYHSEYGA